MTGKRLRCAIYTRKSSEEGLDQSFNSLDAQREACAAYIASQKGEGWLGLPARYDDGGYSGGNMDRPGLTRLMADIEAGRIDVVVVYKVDRLTRSLSDFARIVDRFDRRGVSFVSVTQAFNTTTSMGRLTLNVLLSFAQFEREVTSERIRDKLAASRKKGMWMGGLAPLGYVGHERTLRIVPDEAVTVRWCFARYLELGSVHALQRELKDSGVVSRVRISGKGRTTGGNPLGRGQLFHLLKNRLYVGEIVHRGQAWLGLHEAIVDRETFDAVQALLASNTTPRKVRARLSPAALVGLIRDATGGLMSPVTARKDGKVWRYYVSSRLQRGAGVAMPPDGLKRVAAVPVEEMVADALRDLIGDSSAPWERMRELISRVTVHTDRMALALTMEARACAIRELPPPAADGSITLFVPVRLQRKAGRVWLEAGASGRTDRRRIDRTLVAGLRRAHRELAKVGIHPSGGAQAWLDCRGIDDRYIRRLATLAFLAPDIQTAVLEGRQPVGLTLQSLIEMPLPLAWEDQRIAIGITA